MKNGLLALPGANKLGCKVIRRSEDSGLGKLWTGIDTGRHCFHLKIKVVCFFSKDSVTEACFLVAGHVFA